MSVHQNRPAFGKWGIECGRRGDVEEQYRRAVAETNDFEGDAGDVLRAYPALGLMDHCVDMAVRDPIRIEVRRLRRDANVVDQARDDLRVPVPRHGVEQRVVINGGRGEARARGHGRILGSGGGESVSLTRPRRLHFRRLFKQMH